MRYLFDTDSSLYLMAGVPELVGRVSACEVGSIGVSTITLAEISMGTGAGKPPPVDVLEAFLEAIELLAFDEAAARAYARLPFRRARFDRLIAAHALALDLTLVTNNEADFADVPGLRVENWTE